MLCEGMMVETMAGKSAALHGLCHDATPFSFSEDNSAIDYFGKLLVKGNLSFFNDTSFYNYGPTSSQLSYNVHFQSAAAEPVLDRPIQFSVYHL